MHFLYVVIETRRTAVLLAAAAFEQVVSSIGVYFGRAYVKKLEECLSLEAEDAAIREVSSVDFVYVQHEFLQKSKAGKAATAEVDPFAYIIFISFQLLTVGLPFLQIAISRIF